MSNQLKEIASPLQEVNEISKEAHTFTSVPFYKNQKFIQWCEKLMTVIGTGGQVLFYLQAYKIYSTGNAESVSLPGFSFAAFSLLCWLMYGLLIKNGVLVFVNAFALLGAILTLLAIFMVA